MHDYRCAPKAGYSGDEGEVDVDECASTPCKNGGTCADSNSDASTSTAKVAADAFHCTNTPGYSGNRGETDFDECSSEPCQNGGTCSDSSGASPYPALSPGRIIAYPAALALGAVSATA